MTPIRYFLNGTFDAALGAAVCGYSDTLGFAADRTGNQNVWVHNVLSQLNDDSYLFLGGGYHLTPADHNSPAVARSAFQLDFDLNNVYTPSTPTGTGEAVPTNVAIPSTPHTWTVAVRWRAVGGTPAGRTGNDLAFSILLDNVGGAGTNLVSKTYAESSPTFRTDTVSIRNPGFGSTGHQFGHTQVTFASEALRDTTAEPPEGPNYLPVQMAWITVTGPNPPVVIAKGRPGYRRGHFI
jgi:hypothetical protein